jgi:hypothetical protein
MREGWVSSHEDLTPEQREGLEQAREILLRSPGPDMQGAPLLRRAAARRIEQMDGPLSFVGPCKILCAEGCDVPEGWEMIPIPMPRHAWDDIAVCPNEGCDLAFIVVEHNEGDG